MSGGPVIKNIITGRRMQASEICMVQAPALLRTVTVAPLVSSSWPSFFQAEDGIRAGHVTGVQTCALPILVQPVGRPLAGSAGLLLVAAGHAYGWPRSEERRVGKECRSRWSPYH